MRILTHLPKDLPEAFEQALERIFDQQYDGKIMKLVVSAATPLHLDEIRIALSVVVGDTVWHPEKIAKDGTQLISLCGGNLLDLDEEDGKVRFIHHSVIQHLLIPAARETTIPYHFTIEDAENLTGAVCVTYLNLPIFDSRIAVRKNIQSRDVLNHVVESTRQSIPGASLIIEHVKTWRYKRATPSQFDIGHILSQIQAARVEEKLDSRLFEQYAVENWLHHTRFFDYKIKDCKDSWRLWWRLLNGGVAAVKPQCGELKKSFSALIWAVEHAHGSLFRNLIPNCTLSERQMDDVVRTLRSHKTICGHWLGDALIQYLRSIQVPIVDMPSTVDRITALLDLGADPTAPHSMWKPEPVEFLADWICSTAVYRNDRVDLLWAISDHPAVQNYTGDKSVLQKFQVILKDTESRAAFKDHQERRPDVESANQGIEIFRETEFSVSSELRHPDFSGHKSPNPKTIIEKALENERWEEVSAWAAYGLINTLTSSGTTLLWKAIEDMSDAWVYGLLKLGADPHRGPFTMKQHIDSPIFLANCFPIEAALWLRRTRVCLHLLCGANADSIGHSPMQIAQETRNWIIIARLREIQGGLRPQMETGQQRYYEHPTALVTVCRMLSRPADSEPPGFPRPPISHSSWMAELEDIIYPLALDGDADYINAQDADGKTALHYLTEGLDIGPHTFQNLLNIFLSRGADPNLADSHGDTPLWLAISKSTPIDSKILPLLRAGADPNAAHRLHNFSILEEAMFAYQCSKQSVMGLVRLLMRAGADPRNPSAPSLTARDPSLILSASMNALEDLIADLQEYKDKWRRQGQVDNEIKMSHGRDHWI